MRMKKLGNTGLLVSELCLGTMTFGNSGGMFAQIGQLQQSEVDGIVRGAIDAGINFLDTADVYHAGQSEVMTGLALRNLGIPRDQFVLATKVFGRMGPRPQPGGSVARAHSQRCGCEPETITTRSHRLVSDPRQRSAHAARGNARGTRHLCARRQGPLHRIVQPAGVADRKIAVDIGQKESRALR